MPTVIPNAIFEFFQGSQIPLTLSDPNLPEDPLILANKAFYSLTGYGPAEVMGKNCRFMQGPKTRRSSTKKIKDDFIARRDSRILIRNYKKDGQEFDNYLYIFTVLDFYGDPIYRIGSQLEIPIAGKKSAFDRHSAELVSGLQKLNAYAEASRQQAIFMSDLIGLSVKDLLLARLQSLKTES
jgi:PAS domain S-box-containing protein